MKSRAMTIRGMDATMSDKLKELARRENKSVNQLLLDMIRKNIGLDKKKKFTKKYDDLDHLFGRWTDEDFKRIQKSVNDQRKVDMELWT